MNPALATSGFLTTAGPGEARPGIHPPLGMPERILALLVIGNLAFGRSFAHLGISPLFINETCLALSVLMLARTQLGTWLTALLQPHWLSGLLWPLALFASYGVIEFVRGLGAGHERVIAVQTVLFNFYPLFVLLGVWVGLRHGHRLPDLMLLAAWVHGVYALLYVPILNPRFKLENQFGGDVPLFSDPLGSAVMILGLLALHPGRWTARLWIPFVLNVGALVVLQSRAEWLGLFLALMLWGYLARQLHQVAGIALTGVLLLLVALIVDVRVPSSATRGGELSARTLVGKFLTPLDPETAKEFKSEADIDEATVEWRTEWWKAIWRNIHQTGQWTLIGPGYGYPLWELHPEELPTKNRTPHSGFMFALGYTGWIGVLLFCTVQLSLAVFLWRAYRLTGQPFGLCVWTALVVRSVFDPLFETPYLAVPFYLLVGLALAPALGTHPSGPPARLEENPSAGVNARPS